jgi:hypothetical protein
MIDTDSINTDARVKMSTEFKKRVCRGRHIDNNYEADKRAVQLFGECIGTIIRSSLRDLITVAWDVVGRNISTHYPDELDLVEQ